MQTFNIPEFKALFEVYNGDIEYDDKKQKAIINLTGKEDKRYQRLADELKRLDETEAEVKAIKESLKVSAKELIADLFKADDVIFTRVVRTTDAVFVLSKDPKPTESVSYSKVLDELEKHLTPEVRAVLEELKKTYTSVSQRLPSLRLEFAMTDTELELVRNELAEFLENVRSWASSFDQKLDAVEQVLNEKTAT